jgi:hypothetical protein
MEQNNTYVLPLGNILEGLEELRITAEKWASRCPVHDFPTRPNKCDTPSLSREEMIRHDRAIADHVEYRLATHIGQAFGNLKSLLLSLEADARSLARSVFPSRLLDKAHPAEHLDAAPRQSPNEARSFYPTLVDPLESGKPESSNREGINPVATTPAVVG